MELNSRLLLHVSEFSIHNFDILLNRNNLKNAPSLENIQNY